MFYDVGKRDIVIRKGDDYTHVFEIQLMSNGTPVSIAGCTFVSQIRKIKTQTVPDASFVCAVSDGPNGEFTITMSHTVTSALTVGCYYWDIQRVCGGLVDTIIEGKATVKADVSR